MKKWMVLLLTLWFSISVNAATPINKLIFFGDSLSDDGNLYKLAVHLVPKSPPYFLGRFTNGPTWAEQLGQSLYNHNYIPFENYAYGGATTIFHMPSPKFMAPMLLPLEVDLYLLNHLFDSKDDVLFAIWIGGNDYLFGDDVQQEDSLTDKVVNELAYNIQRLIYHGATKFLILNLPDLGKVPYAVQNHVEARLSLLTQLHNEKLAASIHKIKKDNPAVQLISIDIYKRFNDLVRNPYKYNKKYNINIVETSVACWDGGFMFKNKINPYQLRKEVKANLAQQTAIANTQRNVDSISELILRNPLLADTYQASQMYDQGVRPCDTADGFVFWDHIHPSAIVHRILALMIEDKLGQTLLKDVTPV